MVCFIDCYNLKAFRINILCIQCLVISILLDHWWFCQPLIIPTFDFSQYNCLLNALWLYGSTTSEWKVHLPFSVHSFNITTLCIVLALIHSAHFIGFLPRPFFLKDWWKILRIDNVYCPLHQPKTVFRKGRIYSQTVCLLIPQPLQTRLSRGK